MRHEFGWDVITDGDVQSSDGEEDVMLIHRPYAPDSVERVEHQPHSLTVELFTQSPVQS